jgi:hypothetical protein
MLISIFIDFALVRYFDLGKVAPRIVGLILTIVSLPITNNQFIVSLKPLSTLQK